MWSLFTEMNRIQRIKGRGTGLLKLFGFSSTSIFSNDVVVCRASVDGLVKSDISRRALTQS